MKKLSILGSTGSIGTNTLDVVERFPDKFKITALAAGRKIELLAEQAKRHKVPLVSVAEEEDARKLSDILGPTVEVYYGMEGLKTVAAASGADMLVSALVGAVGLVPTLEALKKGMDVAVANKETLVVAGALVRKMADDNGCNLLPIDSEHSAIFQVLEGRDPGSVKRLILTASGGPFRGRSAAEVAEVTPAQALAHPNWSMGPKISIDSATMMNKGLEVIEAYWLFDLGPDKIDVAIHPQSIVHSMVEFVDGSMIAQLGVPDMRGPISYALAYPERLPMEALSLDIWSLGGLTFEKPDMETFPCLGLAYQALGSGGTAPAILSAANEIAVEKFLTSLITFADIPRLVDDALNKIETTPLTDLSTALEADTAARGFARDWPVTARNR